MPGTEFLVFNVELLDLINFVDNYKYTEVELLSKMFRKSYEWSHNSFRGWNSTYKKLKKEIIQGLIISHIIWYIPLFL